ncbi:hypothetical protein B0T22DRAFT_475051 [Podospora appendiculata]|uniref:Uncharacterized protein n=1 Tax=Podospora appendiculata TaxID=314037 RepID=A0AAE0XEM7_9PEZI|nr:hypothetical protein B0T22DRAFT_475051 [Podospora appendiculata]
MDPSPESSGSYPMDPLDPSPGSHGSSLMDPVDPLPGSYGSILIVSTLSTLPVALIRRGLGFGPTSLQAARPQAFSL